MTGSGVVNVRLTLGALLAGGVVCTALSGIVSMQTYIYSRIYRRDKLPYKLLVLFVWTLDLLHTSMVAASNWFYLIDNFGLADVHDVVHWSVGASIAITAVITFAVHCFFVHRLYRLSKGNIWLTAPIGAIALCRVGSACITTSEMIKLGSFSLFLKQFRWVFTLGLSLSTTVDILIAGSLCYFLRKQRTGLSDMDVIIDSVILYTVENGILTCMATIAALVCWVAMPHNLVFMGLHFAISKLYANSLLASLNTRKSLRRTQAAIVDAGEPNVDHPHMFPVPGSPIALSCLSRGDGMNDTSSKLQISVQRTVDYVIDGYEPYLHSVRTSEEATKSRGIAL